MTPTHVRGLSATLLAVLVAGCGGGRSGAAAARTAPTPVTAAAPGPDAGAARARADSARLPWTAADARFMSMMIGHHAQAIEMARMAPTHGASPQVRVLADRIINAQQDEIATMQQWLRDRRQPVPEAKVPDAASHDMSAHAGHDMAAMPGMSASGLMPGMLAPEQMRKLDAARGKEFDRLFLTSMIQHHRGATSMVKDLFETDGAAQDETVFKFASDVNVDQTTEIARMERMLLALVVESGAP